MPLIQPTPDQDSRTEEMSRVPTHTNSSAMRVAVAFAFNLVKIERKNTYYLFEVASGLILISVRV